MKRAWVIAGIIVAGLLLSGCDKCGDWFWLKPGTGSCSGAAPSR